MHERPATISAGDGTALHLYRWLPRGSPRAVVQIAHGMAEHAGRYAALAGALTAAGYAVHANDHRGHGLTAGPGDHGYLADHDGFGLLVEDLRVVTRTARAEHPGVPLVLLGHSMGSFLGRAYAAEHRHDLDGLVLSGTGGDPGPPARLGRVLARAEGRLRGARHPSVLLDRLTFGRYNRAFAPTRTRFDWLSRDPAEVDAYVADPLCGNVFSSGFFVDLLGGVIEVTSAACASRLRADLPVLILSGGADPVGGGGRAPREVQTQYRRAGLVDVTCLVYPDARHELFHEVNREDVTGDLLAWLDAHVTGDAGPSPRG